MTTLCPPAKKSPNSTRNLKEVPLAKKIILTKKIGKIKRPVEVSPEITNLARVMAKPKASTKPPVNPGRKTWVVQVPTTHQGVSNAA